MAITIPPGGQVPVEPVRLKCATPPDCEAAKKMVADARGMYWHYWGVKTYPGQDGFVEVDGYDEDMANAWLHQLLGAWPPPPKYKCQPGQAPANCYHIVSQPL